MGRIICGIDIETNQVDKQGGAITEIAWVIKDTDDPKPLRMRVHFVRPRVDVYISPENFALTKISAKHLAAGTPLTAIYSSLISDIHEFGVEAFVAHNGANFDRPWLILKLRELGFPEELTIEKLPWIDTVTDLGYPDTVKARNLIYLAAHYNFLNPFPHSALSDVQTMLKVLENFDIEEVFTRIASPWVDVRANVTYDQKELAKERGFRWEKTSDEAKPYYKTWVKRVRACDLEALNKDCPFAIFILGE